MNNAATTSPRWTAWAILAALLATVCFAVLAWHARALGALTHAIAFSVAGYVLGALVCSVLWNLQLNQTIKAQSQGVASSYALNIFRDPDGFAKLCALLGIASAIAAIIPFALHLAVIWGGR